MNFSAIRDMVARESVRLAPTGVYTEAIGWSARRTVPRWARVPVYRAFARAVGARLDEVELPLAEYATLGSFFARRLRDGARELSGDDSVIVAPCDGRIASVGVTTRGRLLQAKGRDYALAELLADDAAARLEDGVYVTIYLSPRDYHRVHAPCAGEVIGYDYVPGTLLPVSAAWAGAVPDLFARNERVVVQLATGEGRAALVMVGATGVGNMALSFAGLETRDLRRQRSRRVHRVRFEPPRPRFERGDELGCFQLGSTVVLVVERGGAALHRLEPGAPVRFGQAIASRDAGDREGAAA